LLQVQAPIIRTSRLHSLLKYPVLIAGRGSTGLACRNTQELGFKRYNSLGRHARLLLQARSLPWLSISVKQRCVASTAGTGTHRDWRHPGRRKRRYIMGRWNVGISTQLISQRQGEMMDWGMGVGGITMEVWRWPDSCQVAWLAFLCSAKTTSVPMISRTHENLLLEYLL
jgi:hypothetical protein